MSVPCTCDAAGLEEPGLQLRGLKLGGLLEVKFDAEELGKLFSQPADAMSCASGECSAGP